MRLVLALLFARSCAPSSDAAPSSSDAAPSSSEAPPSSDTFGVVDRALLPVVGPAWADDAAAPCAWSNESFARAAKLATANHYADRYCSSSSSSSYYY